MVKSGVRRPSRSWLSAGSVLAAGLVMTVMGWQGRLTQAADSAEAEQWEPGDTDTVLPGLIPAPAEIPELGRWQAMALPIGAYVESAEFSPDGRRFVFGDGKYVRIHDAELLDLTGVLAGHAGIVRAVSWSPDGKWIVSGGDGGTVRLWKADGVPVTVLKEHDGPVRSVAWHPQSESFVSASMDGTISMWGIDGTAGVVIEGHDAPVTAVAWNPDGTKLAAGDENRSVRVWTADGDPGPVLEGHLGAITHVRWSPDGQWLASTSMGLESAGGSEQQEYPAVRLWKSDGTGGLTLYGHRRSIRALAWSPDSRQLVTAAEDRQMLLWSVDGALLRRLNEQQFIGVSNDFFTLDWDAASNRILAGSRFNVQFASPEGTEQFAGLKRSWGGKFMHLDWHPSEDQIAIASEDSSVQIWAGDFSSHRTIHPSGNSVGRVRWSADGSKLASVSMRSEVHVWKSDGELLQDLGRGGWQPNGLSWTPDGTHLAVGERGNQSRVLGLDGTSIDIEFHEGRVLGTSFSPDGKLLATGGYDTNARILRLNESAGELQEVALMEAFDGDVDAVAWSPDGQWVATGHETSLCLWSADGTPGPVMQAGESAVVQIAWSPDSQRLVTGSWDTSVRLWSIEGEFLKEYPGHMAPCYGVSYSPDGKKLATCGWDGVARVLDVESGEILATLIQVEATDRAENADGRSSSTPEHATIAFSRAGQVIAGDRDVLDQQIVYLVEQSDGAFRILSASEFSRKAAGAVRAESE